MPHSHYPGLTVSAPIQSPATDCPIKCLCAHVSDSVQSLWAYWMIRYKAQCKNHFLCFNQRKLCEIVKLIIHFRINTGDEQVGNSLTSPPAEEKAPAS